MSLKMDVEMLREISELNLCLVVHAEKKSTTAYSAVFLMFLICFMIIKFVFDFQNDKKRKKCYLADSSVRYMKSKLYLKKK